MTQWGKLTSHLSTLTSRWIVDYVKVVHLGIKRNISSDFVLGAVVHLIPSKSVKSVTLTQVTELSGSRRFGKPYKLRESKTTDGTWLPRIAKNTMAFVPYVSSCCSVSTTVSSSFGKIVPVTTSTDIYSKPVINSYSSNAILVQEHPAEGLEGRKSGASGVLLVIFQCFVVVAVPISNFLGDCPRGYVELRITDWRLYWTI